MLKLAVLLSVPPLCFAFRFFGNSRRASPLATLKLMRMMMDESGSSNGAGGGVRTYSSYALYKGKGALAVKPLPATLVTSGSARTVSRNGGMLLEFALASGPREYNW